jgi:hypothetical protein
MDANSNANDFDFLLGRWKIRHRRLKERLVGCVAWKEFDGTAEMWRLMDGRANVDNHVIELPGGAYQAASLRSFDAISRKWAIWWLDGRTPHHPLDPPVVGSFERGVGSFYADVSLNGQPIRIRFLWSDISANSCRWEQAFSADSGETWEVNWIMNYLRLGNSVEGSPAWNPAKSG